MNGTITDHKMAQIISAEPRGVGIEMLMQSLGEEASRRTMQRRLEEFMRLGWIERHGKARATKYHVTETGRATLLRGEPGRLEPSMLREDPPPMPTPQRELVLPKLGQSAGPELGEESKHLRDIIRQPQALRKVCGYRREFLDTYQPDKTAYLPETLRKHLHGIGQSEHMAAMPAGTYARHVLDRLIIDLSWNSSRLEGSTYSLLETDHLLALGKSDDPVRFLEMQMILNHKAAIEFLVESPDELGFNRYTFLNLHAILSEGLLKNANSEGALRTIPVGVGGTVYHPTNQPALVEECFDLILRKAAAISDPLECSFFLMVHLPYLQPFEDGNKRTSRLSANLPLIQKNMSPLSFVDVPVRDYTDGILAVYELNRIELLRDLFAWAYERSAGRYASIRQEMGDPDPLHVRYRIEVKDRIRDVVVNRMGKMTAAEALRRWALQNITASDRAHFIEIVEERLLALNEGSIARVRVRPSEFAAWWPVWTKR
jgi:hypothetical protein